MRQQGCVGIIVAFGLWGCVSADVAQEVTVLSEASEAVSDRTLSQLAPDIAAFEAAAPERAAANRDLWTLSEDCTRAQEVFNYDALQRCEIVKVENATIEAAPTKLQAVERKLSTMTEYTGLLADLASAQTESEIKLAFGALGGALDNLGTATGSSGIGDISDLISENEDKIGAVVDASVSALRARYLRRTVAAAHPQIVQLSGEIKATLLSIGFDGRYAQAVADLRAAEITALEAVSADTGARAAAYRALEDRHAAFIAAAEASVYFQLDQVVAAHGGLRARLAARPSADDLKGYVRALKDLKATLKG